MSGRPTGRPDGPGPGAIRPTTPGPPVVAACIGLVVGWALRPLSLYAGADAPRVTWLQAGVVAFVAAVLLGTALVTWRELQVNRSWLEAHRAVNRLIMAKSCVLVGALLAGGYGGSVVSWIGVAGESTDGNIVRAACAALAAIVIVVAAIWLERACRVHDDEDADLA